MCVYIHTYLHLFYYIYNVYIYALSMADKICLTQDRVLHRGALDAAQCHRAYAQVAVPFRDAVSVWGWIRAFNEAFLRKMTGVSLVGKSPSKSH